MILQVVRTNQLYQLVRQMKSHVDNLLNMMQHACQCCIYYVTHILTLSSQQCNIQPCQFLYSLIVNIITSNNAQVFNMNCTQNTHYWVSACKQAHLIQEIPQA